MSDETLYKVLRETKNQEQIENNINFCINQNYISFVVYRMKKYQNRFSIVNSYKKEQAIELLSKLSLEQLLTVINFNKK